MSFNLGNRRFYNVNGFTLTAHENGMIQTVRISPEQVKQLMVMPRGFRCLVADSWLMDADKISVN